MRVRREEDRWAAVVSLCLAEPVIRIGFAFALWELDPPFICASCAVRGHLVEIQPDAGDEHWAFPVEGEWFHHLSLLLSVLILLSPFQYWHVAHRCWFGWTDGITIVRSSFSCLGLNLCLRLLVSPHHEGELPAALICVRHECIQVFAEWRMPSREFEADWARIRGCLED